MALCLCKWQMFFHAMVLQVAPGHLNNTQLSAITDQVKFLQ